MIAGKRSGAVAPGTDDTIFSRFSLELTVAVTTIFATVEDMRGFPILVRVNHNGGVKVPVLQFTRDQDGTGLRSVEP